MVHVHNRSVAAVPLAFAFDYTADFRHAAEWMFGISALDVVGDIKSGLGTVCDGSIKLGPKTLHSKVEVTAWERDKVIATKSIEGFVNNSIWRFQSVGEDRTEITADVIYELPGGIAGRALGRIIEPFVHLAVKHSDEKLKHQLEQRHRDSTRL